MCGHQNFVMCIQNRDVAMKLTRCCHESRVIELFRICVLKPQTILLFFFFFFLQSEQHRS
jgi:hypothetical protein